MLDNFNTKPTILISPLPWGLGHASRCIPLITELLQNQCTVILGASGESKTFLSIQFPDLQVIDLHGYHIKYSKVRSYFFLKILLQIPGIVHSIIKEHRHLQSLLNTFNIDVVISDNRPAMFHRSIYSIYITHQLKIKTGLVFTGKLVNHIHHLFIKKYNECWVPDDQKNSLAGKLSCKGDLKNITYIGPLSRFNLKKNGIIIYEIICVLSGPEPQRTLLENLLLNQLKPTDKNVFFVRGTTIPAQEDFFKNEKIEFADLVSSEQLNSKIEESELVICRSGYSSIMDLIKLRKKAILIPTPGQPEQEYLAEFHANNHTFLSYKQDQFNLAEALKATKNFDFIFPEVDMDLYKTAIKNLLKTLNKQVINHQHV